MTVETPRRAEHEWFEPNSWAQQRAIDSTVSQMLYSGRLGSSKSRTLCEKVDERCRKYPGASTVVTRRYQKHLFNTTLNTFFRDTVSPAERAYGWRPSNPGGSTFFYPPVDGKQSRILWAGLDKAESLNSGEFDLILIDQAEETNEDQWDICAGRLRHRHGPYRQLAAFCNPDGPMHYLFRLFRPDLGSHIERLDKDVLLPNGALMPKGFPFREVVLAGRSDNLENLQDEYLLMMSKYRGTTYERMVLGLWVMPIGVVYSMYNPALHVIGIPDDWKRWGGYPPPDWPRFCGIDLGFDNPFACLWFAQSPDGVLYVYREHYMSNRTVPQHARTLVEAEEDELAALRFAAKTQGAAVEKQYGSWLDHLNIVARFCDHDRGEREQFDEAFRDADSVATSPAEKDINAGLQSVYRRLQPITPGLVIKAKDIKAPPRIYFIRDCLIEEDAMLAMDGQPTTMFEEFQRYRFYKRRRRLEEAGDSKYDKPVDQFNHAMDALRYGVHSWDRGRDIVIY